MTPAIRDHLRRHKLDADNEDHAAADAAWRRLHADREELVSTSYVLVEAFALVQARLGMEAVRALHTAVVPVLRIEWIDAAAHAAAVAALLTANRRRLSLVDCASFETMRRLGIARAFAFDGHFAEQGFELVP